MKVYSYCVMYKTGNLQIYKNGFFEAEEIKSAKEASEIQDNIKNILKVNSDNFILISLSIVGETK